MFNSIAQFGFQCGDVKVAVESKNGQVLFSVWDSGTGISVENQKLDLALCCVGSLWR